MSARSAVMCVVTWPLLSTSRRTSMRPSSGGSSRMSNWLAPACARTAIATASPATGTGAFVAAADDAEPDALAGDVAAARAEKPKFGMAVRSVFAAVACVFDVAALVVAEVVGSGAFTAARSLVAAAAASDGGAPTSSGSTPWL